MTSYLKNIIYCLSLFLAISLIGCKEPEPDIPELPPTIIVKGDNPLKTGIYMLFVDDSVTMIDRYGIDTSHSWVDRTDVDTSLLGYYKVFYYAQSLSGLTAEAQRDVWVVVKPESMKGEWNVFWENLSSKDTMSFVDSLGVENKKLILNNLNNIPEFKIELSLAADLQDSVYIFEQYRFDSLYCVFGVGTIDTLARKMILNYSLVKEKDTTKCQATYLRQTTSTK
jgi:hypothetical protein